MANNEVRWMPLREFIALSDRRNTDGLLGESSVVGLSTSKEIIKTKANLEGVSLTSYKIFAPGNFAYVADTSRRGDKVSLGFNSTDETFLVSSISVVFEVLNGLIPEYLFMWYYRPEFNRYARFYSWGSAREAFDFEDMCRVQIPIPYSNGKPDENRQRVIAEAWSGLRKMRDDNAKLVEPLMQLCRSYMEDLKKRLPLIAIGPYIHRHDSRNHDNKIKIVKSVSVKKVFNDTNAKVNKNELSSYKIVMPNQLSFVQTTHNEKCLCIAVNRFDYPVVVTSVNEVFSTDEEVLLPDFLYLFFTRKEFDRYARFNSWGSARETFDWDEMCKVKIPIPSPSEQKAIVDIFMCAERAKHIAEEADRLSREICPALMQHIIHEND